MKKFFVVLYFLFSSDSIFAAPPSLASIEKLFAASKSDQMLDSMMSNLTPVIRNSAIQSFGAKAVNLEQLESIEQQIAKIVPIMRDEMAWVKMKPMMTQIYVEALTQEDVDGLISFYESPTGRVMIEKMPTVFQKSIEMSQKFMAPIFLRMQSTVIESVQQSAPK